MPYYLRLVWIALGVLSFVAVGALFMLPADWRVERMVTVDAPPDVVYPWLEDLQRWRDWSPWQETDYEDLVFEYSGPPSGPGATQQWNSETTGDGRIEIVAVDPGRQVAFEMSFQAGKITARDTITLIPLDGGRTRVVWTDQGRFASTLLGKLSLPVVEASMGRDIETGLGRLATAVETVPTGQPPSSPDSGGSSRADSEPGAASEATDEPPSDDS